MTRFIRRRPVVLGALVCLAVVDSRAAEPSANDWIAGQIVKIDAEAGRITLQHEPIPYLHLGAGTTTFRYVQPKWLIGRRAGERVRFRADRIDLALHMTALLYVPN